MIEAARKRLAEMPVYVPLTDEEFRFLFGPEEARRG